VFVINPSSARSSERMGLLIELSNTPERKRPTMALTVSQRDQKIAVAEKRLAKAELAIKNVDYIKAELEWLQAAPTVPDPPADAPKRGRKPKGRPVAAESVEEPAT
jgi:hypothetical protein